MKKVSKLLSVLLCLAMVVGIFAMTVSAATATISAAEFNLPTSAAPNPATTVKGEVTFTVAKNNGNNYPVLNGQQIRFYGKTSLTISIAGGYKIDSIVIASTSYQISDQNAVFTNATATGLGSATVTLTPQTGTDDVVITNPNSSGNFRVETVTVTYSAAGPAVDVESVSITPATAQIAVGETTSVSATVAPADASNKNVTWNSSDPSVATVENGTIFALKAGTTNITATSNNSKVGTCVLTVSPASTLAYKVDTDATFADGDQIVLVEETNGLIATTDISQTSSGRRYKTTPAVISNGAVAVITKAAVFTLESSTDSSFKLKIGDKYVYWAEDKNTLLEGIPGTDADAKFFNWAVTSNGIVSTEKDTVADEYRAIAWNDSGYFSGYKESTLSATYMAPGVLYRIPQAVTGVTLDKTSQNLTVGGTVELVATVAPDNATNKAVTWTSNDPTVAEVSAAGKVTAKKAGTATITVTTADGSKTATCAITVSAAAVPATSVTLDKTTASLAVGADVTLAATVAPAGSTDTVAWTTSNAAVATVANGKIAAVAPGTATITATAGSKSATCTVTVTAAVSKVELNKETASVVVESELDLSATVTANPDAADYKKVTWTTSDATIATVENGKVKALKTGTVTITATSVTDTTKKATCTVTVVSKPAANAGGLITSIEQLKTGTYVLVAGNGFAPATLDGTWLTAAEPTVSGTQIADTKNATWTLTVKDGKVSIKDSTGKYIAPKGGNNNGIKEGEYWWTVECVDGKFSFLGNGEDTVRLACNTESENKFRAYKNTTATGDYAEKYPSTFSVYAVGDTASSTGDAFEPMVIVLALAAVSALAVLALNKKKFSF